MNSRQILVSFISTADFCVTLGRHGLNLKCQIRVGIGLKVGECVGHGRDDGRGVCKCGHRTGPVEEFLGDVRPERAADPVHLPREVIRHDLFPGVLEVVGDALGRSVAGEVAEHGRNVVEGRREGGHNDTFAPVVVHVDDVEQDPDSILRVIAVPIGPRHKVQPGDHVLLIHVEVAVADLQVLDEAVPQARVGGPAQEAGEEVVDVANPIVRELQARVGGARPVLLEDAVSTEDLGERHGAGPERGTPRRLPGRHILERVAELLLLQHVLRHPVRRGRQRAQACQAHRRTETLLRHRPCLACRPDDARRTRVRLHPDARLLALGTTQRHGDSFPSATFAQITGAEELGCLHVGQLFAGCPSREEYHRGV